MMLGQQGGGGRGGKAESRGETRWRATVWIGDVGV